MKPFFTSKKSHAKQGLNHRDYLHLHRKIGKPWNLFTIATLASSLFLFSCVKANENPTTSQDLERTFPIDAQASAPVYSVMYRVWNKEECEIQAEGVTRDRLFKDGNLNGFVCVSKKGELVGEIDTIGINFQAEGLEHCQKIVSSYWTGAPSNRYSFYQNPSPREREKFLIGENTCSVGYPNP